MARPESRGAAENRRLLAEIRVIHAESRRTYGSSRVHATLQAQGGRIGAHRVITWGMGSCLTQELATAALTMALEYRRPARGVVHHTDRGSQYAATRYRELLAGHGLTAA